MKLPRLSFRRQSESKFEPTDVEKALIETCTRPGMGHLETHAILDEAGLPSDRRGPIEELIRSEIMANVLKSGKERPGCLT